MGKPIFVVESDEVMNPEGHEGVAQVEWRVGCVLSTCEERKGVKRRV